jgi:hypothetical protein
MDEQLPQSEIKASPYQAPMHNFGSSIVYLTNPSGHLKNLELTYRGVYENQDGEIIQVGEPLMNDKGINSVTGIIRTIVNQNTIFGNLERNEVFPIIDYLADTLAKDLMLNRCEYKIKSNSDRSKIYFSALTMAFITLTRSREGDDKRFWKGSVQEFKTTTEVTGQKRKGIFSSLFPWGNN